MSRPMILWALLGVLACGGVALAGDAADRHLERAREVAASDDPSRAGIGFGKAAAAAQQAGELDSEAVIAAELVAFLRSRPDPGPEPAPTDRIAATLDVLGELDHGRLGAYVSSQRLCLDVLRHAVYSGDTSRLPIVATYLAEQGRGSSSGKAIRLLGKVTMEVAKEPTATEQLASGLSEAREHGWHELTALFGLELTARYVAAEDAEKATAALAHTITAFEGERKGSQAHIDFWNVALKRLKGAPADVLKPLLDLGNQRSDYAPGAGAGGAGADAGPAAETPIGEKWSALRRKPFVSVRRTTAGLVISVASQKKPVQTAPLTEREVKPSHDGVTLWLCGSSVALLRLELVENRDGLPAASGAKQALVPYYALADGEEWRISKSGAVTIK